VGGTEVAIGVLAFLVVLHDTGDHLLAGIAFSAGFIALLLGRSGLFTEGFLVPVVTVAAKRATVLHLAKLWSGTLVANLVGGWSDHVAGRAGVPRSPRRPREVRHPLRDSASEVRPSRFQSSPEPP